MILALMMFAETTAIFPPGLPFAEARRAGDLLFISGQVGNKLGTLDLVPGGLPAEAKQTMDNIGTILAKNGLTYDDLVQCRVFLADIKEWGEFNKVYTTYFKSGKFPARAALGANGLAVGARTEVECIAQFPAKAEEHKH